jgi:myo-inositol-1(or 4)-monophosphatase
MNPRYEFIISTIEKAGELLLESRKKHFEVSSKEGDSRNLVSSVDIEINKFITGAISRAYPGEKIYSEESPSEYEANNKSWAVDPIDGTSNFVRNIPHFAISLGFIENGETVMGAVYNPVTKELFGFQKNGGVFLNRKKVETSSISKLSDAYILLHIGRRKEVGEWGIALQKIFLESAKKNINFGSSALDLCFLASGRVDAVVYGTLTTLDVAPAIEMIRMGGGEVYTIKGEPVTLSSEPQQIIATSTRALFDEIINVMNKSH